MRVGFLLVMLLALPFAGRGAEPPAGEHEAVIKALGGYNAALQAGQPEKVLEFLGPTCFMAGERTFGGSDSLSAHMFLSGQALRSWPSNYLGQVAPHRNAFRVVSVDIRRDAAVVMTRDTGSNKFRSWQDEEVAWFLGRSEGRWRVVGFVIRDIQLPKGPPSG